MVSGEAPALLAAYTSPSPGEQPAPAAPWQGPGTGAVWSLTGSYQSKLITRLCQEVAVTMKVLLVLPGPASQKKQSCLSPDHRYFFPPLFLVPAQVFVQQGSEPEQTKIMKIVLEENKAWIYRGQEQAPSVEMSS